MTAALKIDAFVKPCNNEFYLFASFFAGAMYPTSMRINEEGRLVVNFKTEARFRGQFVMSHPGKRVTHTNMPLTYQVRPFCLSINLLLDYPVTNVLSSISGLLHSELFLCESEGGHFSKHQKDPAVLS